MLTAALLVFLAQAPAEPPWDEEYALVVREQLQQHPLPGLSRLEHLAAEPAGWRVELNAPSARLSCAPEKKSAFACRGPSGAEEPTVTKMVEAWLVPLEVPAGRSVELTLGQAGRWQPFATLVQHEGARHSLRILVANEPWQLSEPIADPAHEIDAVELSVAPLQVPGGRLVVMRYDEGGNGNNASGTVAFRGFILRDIGDPARFGSGDSIDLGGGMWGRFVGDDGFHMGSSANLLCAREWPAGFELYEACPASVDPRSFASYAQWCERPCPKGKLAARTGRYLVRQGRLSKARGAAIREPRPDELRLVEVPEPGVYGGLDWTELRNDSSAVLALRGLLISNTLDGAIVSPASLASEPDCYIDAHETLLLERRPLEADAGIHFCELLDTGPDATQPIDLYREPRWNERNLRLGRFVGHYDGGWEGEGPRRSWQLDARGRWCLASATPGTLNACP